VTIDLGTGDGRLPYVLGRDTPDRFFVGIDANAAALRRFSGRADRERVGNLVYVRAAAETLPSELTGVADSVTTILHWGSLLAAAARPSAEVLRSIRALCQPGATLTVVFGLDAVRDRAEAARLGLPPLDERHLRGALASGYARRASPSPPFARWTPTTSGAGLRPDATGDPGRRGGFAAPSMTPVEAARSCGSSRPRD